MTDVTGIKEKKLTQWFAAQKGVIVAFSGGVDSALLLFMARKILGREKALGVISKSESLKEKDFQTALDFAEKYDITLKVIHTRELQDRHYYENSNLRCYFCKTHLYNDLELVKKQYPGFVIANGSNADDNKDYRPGEKAAGEFKISAPLAECGLTKKDIRTLAGKYDLPVWNKPASPCLSSRVPYGTKITPHTLKQIETAESILNTYGFDDVRARYYKDTCKIEVPAFQIPRLQKVFDEVSARITEQAGFKKCELDEEGLVSGKLNRVLIPDYD